LIKSSKIRIRGKKLRINIFYTPYLIILINNISISSRDGGFGEKKEKRKRNAKMWGKDATEHQIWARLQGRDI
jgi:hypothetical protein